MSSLSVLRAASHQWSHWGDYGELLIHGMTNHLPRQSGELQLERTGPFVPSVSFPGISDIVLTDNAKSKLSALVPQLVFRPVRKTRIVRLNWLEWNASAPEPPFYPESGEPEDYMLARESDEILAAEIGPMWELVPDIVPEIQARGGRVILSKYRGQHLVRANATGGYNFASSALRMELLAVAPMEVSTEPARGQDDA